MTETTICECDGAAVEGCKHIPEGNEPPQQCSMPSKMLAWPSRADRDAAQGTATGAVRMCVACAGHAITNGWALRSDPRSWGRR